MARNHKFVWDGSKGPAQNASVKLPELSKRYFRAGHALLRGTPSPEALHRFRLETKRFRYTLELFRPCYGPGLDRRLAMIRKIQDYLGEISDCRSTQKLVGKKQERISRFLERKIFRHRRQLQKCWRSRFGKVVQQRWLTDYLARFSREPSAK